MSKIKVLFGLEDQGHIPTIEAMLDKHRPWDEINKAIGWAGSAANDAYIRYLRKQIEALQKENAELRCLLRKLLNKVNRVTTKHRHSTPIPDSDLWQLVDRQIEVEKALEQENEQNS